MKPTHTRIRFPTGIPRLSLVLSLAFLQACGSDAAGPPEPASVVVTAPKTAFTALGETTSLSAMVLDNRGQTMTGVRVTWTSSNADVVRVDSLGTVTAMGSGTAAVTAHAPPASSSVQFVVEQVPTGFDTVGGAAQQGEVGMPLPLPVSFRLTDARGHPIAGGTVALAVTAGGGSVTSPSVLTDANGLAQATWTLGTVAGQPQTLAATAGNLVRTVSATALPGPPATLERISRAQLTGYAGEPLPDSLTARVVDRFGNPVPGTLVTWNVDLGGGSVAPPQTMSGVDGMARTRWTLGGVPGANQAKATVGAAVPAVFQATGLPNGVIEGTVGLVASFLSVGALTGLADMTAASSAPPSRSRPPAVGPLAEMDFATYAGAEPTFPAANSLSGPDTLPSIWIVHLREDPSTPPALARSSVTAAAAVAEGMRTRLASIPPIADGRVSVTGVSPVLGVARVQIREGVDERAAIESLRQDPRVERVEPAIFYRAFDDPVHETAGISSAATSTLVEQRYYPQQSWHYGAIGLPRAWEITEGSPSVIVAVVDDGIRFDHVALAPNLTSDGYDFVSDLVYPHCSGGIVSHSGDGDGYDPDPTKPASFSWHAASGCATGPNAAGGHGLHVAGTIAAAGNGVVGVAPRVRIRPVRVLGTAGLGTSYDIAQGILYAAGLPADNGNGGLVQAPSRAHIINLSLGGPQPDQTIASAVAQAIAAGSLVIAAAGNSATSAPHYPASFDGVLSVSAVGPDLQLASYSNWGSTVDIAAPGGDQWWASYWYNVGDVWSTYWNFQSGTPSIAPSRGTSMAAPHVSGVAALVMSLNPGMTAQQVQNRLISTAVDLGAPGRDNLYGYGLVDAFAALTNGFGFPTVLHTHLVDATTGARVATFTPGADQRFRFSGLDAGSYVVYAGLDDRGDGVTGVPGFPWGAHGGASTPSTITVQGHGTHHVAFNIGYPAEQEPNDGIGMADVLAVGGYAYAQLHNQSDMDVFRVHIPQAGTYTFETGGWLGLCGSGTETDTKLELLTSGGAVISSNDDVDVSRDRLCSRIAAFLQPGIYHVRVTGWTAGSYTIRAY